MKKEISVNKANRLINDGPVALVSLLYKHKPNIFTVAWNMPVSSQPLCVAIACGFKNYSTTGIKESCEFVINIPDQKLKEEVIGCGSVSGRDTDKFQKFNLNTLPSKTVHAPGIKECIGHLECIVSKSVDHIDHTIFIAKVVSAQVDEDKWDFENNVWIPERSLSLHHLGGKFFSVTQKIK